jgi:hypothetical protein
MTDKTKAYRSKGGLTYGDVQADGGRYIFDGRRCIGRLMPEIDQATAEASPGIQSWSHPRAKGGPDVKLMDEGASILDFSDYCRRHLLPTYPHTK